MTDKSMHTDEEALEPASLSGKKPYERPVLTKLGALRDVTLTQFSSKGNRDGRKNRYTGRGGLNGLPQDSAS